MKKKLLFICAGGLDRSPTAESLFKNNLKFEAQSCGLYPLTETTPISKYLLRWADEIIVMEIQHKKDIMERFPLFVKDKSEILVLNIPNQYVKDDPELLRLLKIKLKKWLE